MCIRDSTCRELAAQSETFNRISAVEKAAVVVDARYRDILCQVGKRPAIVHRYGYDFAVFVFGRKILSLIHISNFLIFVESLSVEARSQKKSPKKMPTKKE